MGFSTDCIHAGNAPDPRTGAVSVPIYQTSTYVQEALGQAQGVRVRAHAEPDPRGARREPRGPGGGAGARAFASGMAAITAVSTFVKAGEHVVCSNMTYGGTLPLLHEDPGPLRRRVLLRGHVRRAKWSARAFRPNTRLLHLESPTNPTMAICDIPLLSEIAHERGALVVVDNTFASPYLQKPLALGADLVVHSTTKFLNGHSDSVGGIAVAARPRARRVARLRSERLGSDPLAARLLARAAGHQDARGPHGAPRGERPRDRAVPRARTRRSRRSTTRAFPITRSTRSRRNR